MADEQIVERFVPPQEASRLVGLSIPTMAALESTGDFPRSRRITTRKTGRLLSELIEWMRDRPLASDVPPDAGAFGSARAVSSRSQD